MPFASVGIATWSDSEDSWELLEPLVTADGVNNELERPHLFVHDDFYHLFFSTQARMFHPEVTAPTGLYGFVASNLLGPYEPLNGHGLVFADPPERPFPAHSCTVLNDLGVVGFIDAVGIDGATGTNLFADPAGRRRGEFGGTLAPKVRLTIRGSQAAVASL